MLLLIKDFIKHHKIWKDANYWVEYFNDELMAKWKQHFANELKVDRDFSLTLICSFVLNMKLNWELPELLYIDIMKNIVYGKALGLDDPKSMVHDVEQFLVKQSARDRALKDTPPNKGASSKDSKVKTPEKKSTLFGKKKSTVKNFSPEGATIKQGWLTKKGKKGKLCWFVLKSEYLIYMESKDNKPTGVVGLRNSSLIISEKKGEFSFAISYGPEYEDFQITTASQIERQEWVDAINKCVQNMMKSNYMSENQSKSAPTDTIDEFDIKTAEKVIAIYDYDGQEANELTLKANDEIIVIKRYPNSQWCKGKLGNKIGLFPVNFTKSSTEATSSTSSTSSSATSTTSTNKSTSTSSNVVKAKAIYDYDAQEL